MVALCVRLQSVGRAAEHTKVGRCDNRCAKHDSSKGTAILSLSGLWTSFPPTVRVLSKLVSEVLKNAEVHCYVLERVALCIPQRGTSTRRTGERKVGDEHKRNDDASVYCTKFCQSRWITNGLPPQVYNQLSWLRWGRRSRCISKTETANARARSCEIAMQWIGSQETTTRRRARIYAHRTCTKEGRAKQMSRICTTSSKPGRFTYTLHAVIKPLKQKDKQSISLAAGDGNRLAGDLLVGSAHHHSHKDLYQACPVLASRRGRIFQQ